LLAAARLVANDPKRPFGTPRKELFARAKRSLNRLQPNANCLWVSYLIQEILVAGDFGHVDCDLCLSDWDPKHGNDRPKQNGFQL
jgi:hypothetical protein